MLDAYIYEGLRTPFGRHAGALAKVRPDDLLADVIKNLLKKSAFKPEQIEDLVVGCANQGGEDSRCVARHAGLVAGLPIETPGTVLQRNCASGLDALDLCLARDHVRRGRRLSRRRRREHEPRADRHRPLRDPLSAATRRCSTARSGRASRIRSS